MEKIVKTPNQVVEQIERWFLRYYNKEKSTFNGSEEFTFFDQLYFEKRNELIRKVEINKHEIPVLILSIRNDEYILNTTERFIRIYDLGTESLFYSDFDYHKGFKGFGHDHVPISKVMNLKSEGHFSEFGLKKKDGQLVYWLLPTGKPGFAFWNITNKFEIIGRRYVIDVKNNLRVI
jgi:hypothetical protein